MLVLISAGFQFDSDWIGFIIGLKLYMEKWTILDPETTVCITWEQF